MSDGPIAWNHGFTSIALVEAILAECEVPATTMVHTMGNIGYPDDEEERADEDRVEVSIARITMPCAACGVQTDFLATEKEYFHVIGGGMLLRVCFKCMWT